MNLLHYCKNITIHLPALDNYLTPWSVIQNIDDIIASYIFTLSDPQYIVQNGIAIHKTAEVSSAATLQAPVVIGPHATIGPSVLLRGGVFIGPHTNIGQGGEVKQSIVGSHTALAHFNYVGNSVIGSHVNLEAGAVIANHYNERADKTIYAKWDKKVVSTGIKKFGACIGDNCKIGANAVTSPGTILPPSAVVNRLQLIEQLPSKT